MAKKIIVSIAFDKLNYYHDMGNFESTRKVTVDSAFWLEYVEARKVFEIMQEKMYKMIDKQLFNLQNPKHGKKRK